MNTVAAMLLFVAGSADVRVLDFLLRSGLLTPERAVALYCAEESTSRQHDAFCACPEHAVRQIYEQLGKTPTS